MRRGEIWWADTGHGGDRPVLVLTRDPVADRIGGVVVAALTSTVRGLLSELAVGVDDGLDRDGVVSFDNINTLRRSAFRRRAATLSDAQMQQACRALNAALGCGFT
ncbi:MAG: type II toxin-antitoxin system PemK/MazF family toxin [Acidimicrobiia bacterium]|nr:type II toxin-antitoxin system PemK/MazF family toxin [Acidimicrobiia bacterium]